MTIESRETEPPQTQAYINDDPTTWTPGQTTRNHRMNAFMAALQTHGSLTQVFQHTEYSEATTHEWRHKYPRFADAVNQFLTQTRVHRVEENLYRIATGTDPKSANAAVKAGEILLKAYDPDRFTERIKQETTLTVNGMVQHVHSSREQLLQAQQDALRALQAPAAPPAAAGSRHAATPPYGQEQRAGLARTYAQYESPRVPLPRDRRCPGFWDSAPQDNGTTGRSP